MATSATLVSTPPRPSVIQLAIQERRALHAAYIPFFSNGGLFIPTSRPYLLGDEAYILLTLPNEQTRYAVAGKVRWITPQSQGNRVQGIGVQFPNDPKTTELREKIEEILGGHLFDEQLNQTF